MKRSDLILPLFLSFALCACSVKTPAPAFSPTETAVPADLSIPETTRETENKAGTGHLIDVPYLSQLPDWPTGCETVSTVMALRFAGSSVSVGDFAEKYLEKRSFQMIGDDLYGPDPNEAFIGDPADPESFGCYAPVILKAVQKMNEPSLRVTDTTGKTLPELEKEYLDRDIPVVVWASGEMQEFERLYGWYLFGSGAYFQWLSHEHCLLLVGYDEAYYYFNDPMRGKNVAYEKNLTQLRYSQFGSMSFAVEAV